MGYELTMHAMNELWYDGMMDVWCFVSMFDVWCMIEWEWWLSCTLCIMMSERCMMRIKTCKQWMRACIWCWCMCDTCWMKHAWWKSICQNATNTRECWWMRMRWTNEHAWEWWAQCWMMRMMLNDKNDEKMKMWKENVFMWHECTRNLNRNSKEINEM